MKRFVIVSLIITLLTTPVLYHDTSQAAHCNGNTLYVGGDGPGNYSAIQDAITDAANGDTIFVYNGTYYENILIYKSIQLLGEEKNTTIIDGDKKGDVVQVMADNVTISGFTVKNGGRLYFSYKEGGGIRLDPSSTEPANEFKVAEFRMGQALKGTVVWGRVARTSVLSV